MLERYFDNAATTPMDRRVVDAMLPFLSEQPGNAHSMHAWGIRARAAVEEARTRVAELIGAESPSQIVFTSGATEANNCVLRSFAGGWVSPFEHSSVAEPAAALGYGILANDGLELRGPEEPAGLLSLMTVNNEIGTLFDPQAFKGSAVHSDATQAVGKLPFDVGELDFVSFSAHKFYGPKGVGGLYARDPSSLSPLLLGGEQEGGLRSGTLNVPGIVGLGTAARIALDEMEEHAAAAAAYKEIVLGELPAGVPWRQMGGPKASPYILALGFEGLEGETILLELDARGFGIGSGAACSSRKAEPSRVLTALGLPTEWIRGTIRISFGARNTPESAQALGRLLSETVTKLSKMRK